MKDKINATYFYVQKCYRTRIARILSSRIKYVQYVRSHYELHIIVVDNINLTTNTADFPSLSIQDLSISFFNLMDRFATHAF